MSPDEARAFVASNHRAVLITRRSGGGLQTSPVLVGVDDEGKLVISTREGSYKTRNLRRDPTAVLCVLSCLLRPLDPDRWDGANRVAAAGDGGTG